MCQNPKTGLFTMVSATLLNLKEVSEILKINTEVLRRWLRSGRLPGIKVGSDWRVDSAALQVFLSQSGGAAAGEKKSENQPKMCFRFPKWLEFSGLPALLNKKFGPEAWPVLKKLIELDFELGKPEDRQLSLDLDEISERVGYQPEKVSQILENLVSAGYIGIRKTKDKSFFTIITPIKTPRLILDIPYEKGGIKGAPGQALTNSCLRRFLESGE